MKKTILISGITLGSLGIITRVIGALFKIMHWPGSSFLFITSTILIVISVILFTFYIIKYTIK